MGSLKSSFFVELPILLPRGGVVLALAGMVCVLFVSLLPVLGDSGSGLQVVSSSHYIDGIGYMRVVGEVKNTGTVAQEYVGVEATFNDSQGTVLATTFDYTFLEVLKPGQSSPFEIYLLDVSKVALVDSYVLETSSTDSSEVPADISITSSALYKPLSWLLLVFGEIKNNEDTCQEYVEVVATFYDASGVVCALAKTRTFVHLVEPGGVTPFELDLIDESRIALVESYSLEVQSDPAAQCPYTGLGALSIKSSSSYVDESGYSRIVGEVENTGNKTAEWVGVAATVYDVQGDVVGVGETPTDPDTVDPGASSTFDIKFWDKEQIPGIHEYILDIGTYTTIATVPQDLWSASIAIAALIMFYARKRGQRDP
jgi:hypothetical protein